MLFPYTSIIIRMQAPSNLPSPSPSVPDLVDKQRGADGLPTTYRYVLATHHVHVRNLPAVLGTDTNIEVFRTCHM
jgi:hypothetical protein